MKAHWTLGLIAAAVVGSAGCRGAWNPFSTARKAPPSTQALAQLPIEPGAPVSPPYAGLATSADATSPSSPTATTDPELLTYLSDDDELASTDQYRGRSYSIEGSEMTGYSSPARSSSGGCGCGSCSR